VSESLSQTRLLQQIVRRESRSLLQYVTESFPWTTPEEREALPEFQRLAAEERDGAAALGRYLANCRQLVPYLGAFPMEFTSINYVSLEHLFPLLAEHAKQSLDRLDRDLMDIQDVEARCLVQNIVDTKRRHLQTLEALAAAYPETHSTVR
jgi:hypothetical protein